MSKISELSDGGSLVSSDYLIAVRSGGNVKVRMNQINVDQVDLGDNEFIRLGNSQDLTMVHTSTQSIINQAGIGDLLLQKAGSTKLTINASGIDVTGSVTADGLTVDGTSQLQTVSIYDNGTNATVVADTGHDLELRGRLGQAVNVFSNGTTTATFANNGDISFYEDTGTTPKLFWDASEERLGIGTTTPAVAFNTVSDTIWFQNAARSYGIGIYADDANSLTKIRQLNSGGSVSINTGSGGANQTTFDSSGRVGIGTTSPSGKLNLSSSANTVFRIDDTNGTSSYHHIETSGTNGQNLIISGDQGGTGGGAFIFRVNGASEAMRIDASGNVKLITANDTAGTSKFLTFGTNSFNRAGIKCTNAATYDGSLEFYTGNATNFAERMRLDASGNLLVGKTAAALATAGIELRADNTAYFTKDSSTPVLVNRVTTDGDLIQFRKDNATVGQIGTRSSGLVVGSGDTGLFYDGGGDRIFPESPIGGAARDAAIDLGTSLARFKDLHLSGGLRGDTRFKDAAGTTEYARFDSLGTLLVGTTDSTPYNNTGAGNGGAGIQADGLISAAREDLPPGIFNRLVSDGKIIELRTDGALKGIIGTAGGELFIAFDGSTTDSGLRFRNSGEMIPVNSTGAGTNGVSNLGSSGFRFKDLYLSGGAYLGGTGAANKLEDYEEGTWTPVYTSTTDATDNVDNSKVGYYTKVGNMVYATATLIGNDLSGITSTDLVRIGGLPFTSSNTSAGNDQAVTVGQYRLLLTTDHTLLVPNNTTYIGATTDGFVAATYATFFSSAASTLTSLKISLVYQAA